MGDETPDRSDRDAAPRTPTLNDLARLCAELNRLGARYVVVGGHAVIQAGYVRTTEDIDLLRQLLEAQGVTLEPEEPAPPQDPLTRGWRRLNRWWRG